MKKLLFIAVIAILSSLNVSAQETPSSTKETSYGVTAGFHVTDINFFMDGPDLTVVDDLGFFIGLFAEFSLSENVSLELEFHYSCRTDNEKPIVNLMLPVFLNYIFHYYYDHIRHVFFKNKPITFLLNAKIILYI